MTGGQIFFAIMTLIALFGIESKLSEIVKLLKARKE